MASKPCPKCGRPGFQSGPEMILSRCLCGYVEAVRERLAKAPAPKRRKRGRRG